MMRKLFAVATMATMVVAAGTASAYSVDLLWQSTGTSTLDYTLANPGTATADVYFNTAGSGVAGQAAGPSTFSFSVQFDAALGVINALEYTSIVMQPTFASLSPGVAGVSQVGNTLQSWDALAAPGTIFPECPPNVAVVSNGGTCDANGYLLGSITFDTSGLTGSADIVGGLFNVGVDGFAQVETDGSTSNIDGLINFNTSSVLVPEPATASLMMLGLAGLAVASRRRA